MATLHRRTFLEGGIAAVLWAGLTRSLAAQEPSSGRARRIKVGQIGVGHAHASKLSVYRASPDYEVVGIVEPDADLRGRAGAQATFRDLPWIRYQRYVGDAADMARILRGEKPSDFSYAHDLDVQETVLRASNLRIDS